MGDRQRLWTKVLATLSVFVTISASVHYAAQIVKLAATIIRVIANSLGLVIG